RLAPMVDSKRGSYSNHSSPTSTIPVIQKRAALDHKLLLDSKSSSSIVPTHESSMSYSNTHSNLNGNNLFTNLNSHSSQQNVFNSIVSDSNLNMENNYNS